ncbi:cell wall elongation regulator TseB-like domain-containing protein [Neobacillus sp. Marseille-QA0830]
MKKWIIIFIVVIVAIVGMSIKVYITAMEPVKTAEKKAVELAGNKVKISQVNDFHIYNGLETVNVIEGKNQQGKKIIVWIPEKTKKVFVKKASSGLTKEEAVQKLIDEKSPVKIISIRLGMEKNIPLWEIYYRSKDNLINYYYVHFETGEWLKQIENL